MVTILIFLRLTSVLFSSSRIAEKQHTSNSYRWWGAGWQRELSRSTSRAMVEGSSIGVEKGNDYCNNPTCVRQDYDYPAHLACVLHVVVRGLGIQPRGHVRLVTQTRPGGIGCRVRGLGFVVQGATFRALGFTHGTCLITQTSPGSQEFTVPGAGCRVWVPGSGFRV